MSLPKLLITKINQGRVVLFLGSGALYGADLPGKKIPLGNDLRDLLCDEFLNPNYMNESLAHVAALAISNSSLNDVQDFIKDYFSDLVPADFHNIIPTLRWRAIFTTNYDRLIEVCYESKQENTQSLSIILSNDDRLDETRIDTDKLPFVKLHGCITRSRDPRLPLILTVDQYNDHLVNRDRLFRHLYELAYENSIVFVGHSLQDANIRVVLNELQKECPQGQRHYLLKPGIDQLEVDFWGEKKITAFDCTFEDFLKQVDNSITSTERDLLLLTNNTSHPIQKWFCDKSLPSNELIEMLANSIELVSEDLSGEAFNPEDFFKGFDFGWAPVEQGLPIHRNLQSQVIEEIVEKPNAERAAPTEFFVIKGEAGSGKTVLLRQVAWQASTMRLGIVLWVKRYAIPDLDLLEEIYTKTKERVFLFWDDASINSIEMNRFLTKAQTRKSPISIITAERYNEWNVKCDDLDLLTTEEFKLNYLSENEIEELVNKLDKHNCLGPNLKNKTHSERCEEFRKLYGRQLLVALHESTMGQPFEAIVFNEYLNITPESAKSIYLTVCTLNRLRIPVRAGLISRIHDISFDRFKETLYKPLEKVVIAHGRGQQDIHYVSRHPEIAEIVFKEALKKSGDRYNEYIRIIKKLNISYSSDNDSFRQLIRAKALHELFPSYEDVSAIYNHAITSLGRDAYLLQQMAIYERIRPNGSLDKGISLLIEASEIAPHDSSILHSLYTIWREISRLSTDVYERKKSRAEARAYVAQIRRKWGDKLILSTSLIELALDDLKDLLDDEYSTQVSIQDTIRRIQIDISENKQRYPSDGSVFRLESLFFKLINENEKTLTALEKSFELNDFEPFLAIKLSNIYCANEDIDRAKNVLEKALNRRRSEHSINFEYAEVLRKEGISSSSDLMYYYRRSFTPSDRNYEAQFWFARFAFNDTDDANKKLALDMFQELRNSRVSHGSKVKVRAFDMEGDNKKIFKGNLIRKRQRFGFMQVDGIQTEIFFPSNNFDSDLWVAAQEGDRLTFKIGYTYTGPVCCDICL